MRKVIRPVVGGDLLEGVVELAKLRGSDCSAIVCNLLSQVLWGELQAARDQRLGVQTKKVERFSQKREKPQSSTTKKTHQDELQGLMGGGLSQFLE